MGFQIRSLDSNQFSFLFGKDQSQLYEYGVERITVDSNPGFPCRVSLKDVEIGQNVLLLNYEHQPALTPYRSNHAIFVQEWATQTCVDENHIPEILRIRLISVRGFDTAGMMIDADVVDGVQLEPVIEHMFSLESVSYLHLHNAKRGCFIARVERS